MPNELDTQMMTNVSNSGKANGQINDKRYDAHQMRIAGTPWELIAAEMGYNNAQAAHRAVQMYLEEASVKFADQRQEDALELQLQRCEALIARYWPAATAGDMDSANYVLKVMGEENKLLRLYEEKGGTQVTKYVVIANSREGYVDELREIAMQSQRLAISAPEGQVDHE